MTIHDFFNKTQNGVIGVRRSPLDPDAIDYLEFSQWELDLMMFYCVNIRPSWVSNAKDIGKVQISVWNIKHDETTELFLVNSNGSAGKQINVARVNISRQRSCPKHLRVSASDRLHLAPFKEIENTAAPNKQSPFTEELENTTGNENTAPNDSSMTIHENLSTDDEDLSGLDQSATERSYLNNRSFPIEIDEMFPLPVDADHVMPRKPSIL